MPYIHTISHNLKRIGKKHGVDLVFTAPMKLSRLCALASSTGKRKACDKSYVPPYVPCTTEVAYTIPLRCGKVYIGQTGQCLNDRLKEHAYSLGVVNNTTHLPVHTRRCGCAVLLYNTKVTGRAKGRLDREILEAYQIKEYGDRCINALSVHLKDKELMFFDLSLN